ncbi:MAG: YceI family protein [Cyclobacteriaceae bacterium]|nr:YceI family protein [Cyclobacteriaceae bacterium]
MFFRTLYTHILVCLLLPATAQTALVLNPKSSKLTITGTSSLHDWQCTVEQYTGVLQAVYTSNEFSDIRSLSFSATVNSIRSIKEDGSYYEKGMDKNVYRAMKSDQHPSLTFSLSKVNSITPAGREYQIQVTGNLRMAGVTKPVSFSAVGRVEQGGMVFEGKVPLKMTDYSIDPPTALFGTIKTGNEVDVHFKMVFQPSK